MSSEDKPPSYEEATGYSLSPTNMDVVPDLITFSSPEQSLETAINDNNVAGPSNVNNVISENLSSEIAKEKEALANDSSRSLIDDKTMYPSLNGEKAKLETLLPPQVSTPTTENIPPGLEVLSTTNKYYIQENFVPCPKKGGLRRNAGVFNKNLADGVENRIFLIQRGQRGPNRHIRHLEILDGSGGGVLSNIISTKRSDKLDIQIQCPPKCRISRVEIFNSAGNANLKATLFTAEEIPVINVSLPPIGQLERQPLLKFENAIKTEDKEYGVLRWSWSTEGDLILGDIQFCEPIDVRIKLAVLGLALTCMEAFSKRWSSSGGRNHHLHRGRRSKHR